MKKVYTSPRVDEVVLCTEQSVMIAVSSDTEKDGSEALINGRRPVGNDWDNMWNN